MLALLEALGGVLFMMAGIYIFRIQKRAFDEGLPGPGGIMTAGILLVIGGVIVLRSLEVL